jgi:hypothetical protein
MSRVFRFSRQVKKQLSQAVHNSFETSWWECSGKATNLTVSRAERKAADSRNKKEEIGRNWKEQEGTGRNTSDSLPKPV